MNIFVIMVLAAYLRQTAAFELERAQVNLIFTYLYMS